MIWFAGRTSPGPGSDYLEPANVWQMKTEQYFPGGLTCSDEIGRLLPRECQPCVNISSPPPPHVTWTGWRVLTLPPDEMRSFQLVFISSRTYRDKKRESEPVDTRVRAYSDSVWWTAASEHDVTCFCLIIILSYTFHISIDESRK